MYDATVGNSTTKILLRDGWNEKNKKVEWKVN